VNQDFKMLIVLLFPFAGAYAGWAVRLALDSWKRVGAKG